MDKNEKRSLTIGGKIALAIWLLISLAGLFFTVEDLITKPFLRLFSIAAVGLYLLVGFYAFFGYKIPHSNIFRYSLLVYAFVLGLMHNTPLADVLTRGGVIICAALIAYMSGRLHKLQSCASVMVAVEIILLASSIRNVAFSPLEAAGIMIVTPSKVAFFDPPILWGSFCLAYLLRYTQHTDAGKTAPAADKALSLPKIGRNLIVAHFALCVLCAALTAVAIFTTGANVVTYLTAIVLYGIAVYYVLWGYKIPHGDLLHYSMLIYAVLSGLMFNGTEVPTGLRAAAIVCTMLAAFMSGRLNKIKDCRWIIPAVAVIHTVVAIIGFFLAGGTPILERLLVFNQPILWGSFAVAYLARFDAHREAGEQEE